MNSTAAAARAAIESMYTDTCDIVVQKKTITDGVVKFQTEKTSENVPCRLSVSSKSPAVNGDVSASVSQKIELFLAPEISVPAGCRITVHHLGIDMTYKASGIPAIYATHQEILLDQLQERA